MTPVEANPGLGKCPLNFTELGAPWTLQRLAKHLGVVPDTVANWERNHQHFLPRDCWGENCTATVPFVPNRGRGFRQGLCADCAARAKSQHNDSKRVIFEGARARRSPAQLTREQLALDVEAYLTAGGKITVLPGPGRDK